MFRGYNSRAFLCFAADQPTNLAVQFHLRELCHYELVQFRKQVAVVRGLTDVHGLSPF